MALAQARREPGPREGGARPSEPWSCGGSCCRRECAGTARLRPGQAAGLRASPRFVGGGGMAALCFHPFPARRLRAARGSRWARAAAAGSAQALAAGRGGIRLSALPSEGGVRLRPRARRVQLAGYSSQGTAPLPGLAPARRAARTWFCCGACALWAAGPLGEG